MKAYFVLPDWQYWPQADLREAIADRSQLAHFRPSGLIWVY